MSVHNPTSKPDRENNATAMPSGLALFLHATGSDAPDAAWVESLRDQGHRLFSHRPLEGVEQTAATLEQLGNLCIELQQAAPGLALVLLRYPLTPSPAAMQDLAALLSRAPGPVAYTTFSNADPECNPWAGLAAEHLEPRSREQLISMMGTGRLMPLTHWPSHLLAFSPAAVQALAEPGLSGSAASGRLRSRRVTPELADWIYVESSAEPVGNIARLEPHEIARPRPWGALAGRLQSWLSVAADLADETHDLGEPQTTSIPRPGDAPVTLHITHSWGGGVATWIRSFIATDTAGLHLQLRSEGPQTGQGAGQRLSLYLGNQLDAPLDCWWLQPSIDVMDTVNGQYREVLDQVCDRYGVGRVLVSSLIGHSLDALRTERPTLQILHDPFPAWPLLGIHPAEFDNDLQAALADPRAREPFNNISPEDWLRVQAQYANAAQYIKLAAPSAAAADLLTGLVPELDRDRITVIPHGLPIRVPARKAIGRTQPRLASEKPQLRILIPGRVQPGKGLALLQAALPELRTLAHITLLGTGKGGEAFFGQSGINVVQQYDQGQLAELIEVLQPDLAVLPSVVPETFSYTLSEMWALGVPVLATRVGSFPERIRDSETGWLCDADPAALVAAVKKLAADPSSIRKVADRLREEPVDDLETMTAAYNSLCPAQRIAPQRPASSGADLTLAEAQAEARSDQLRNALGEVAAATQHARQLDALVEERTQWAQAELQQRKIRDKELAVSIREIESLTTSKEALEQSLDGVLTSRSWRMTAPIRAAKRLIKGLVVQRAWNPLRWPLLLSQTVRNLSTVGLRGTLNRMQHFDPQLKAPGSDGRARTVEYPQKVILPDAVPCDTRPRVSVIIPAYNHLAYTAACLSSIARARDATPLEIILVDDESSDKTQARLTGLPGLRYFRNTENQGFIRSCNRGLTEARGEFVLFLNNDTQVEDHWLERLLETFAQQPDAGLVGARLVYPDGSLQECGGMVLSDGSGWNLGRGDNPDKPDYQFLREVDYCSGACIVLRRDLLESLGGFDEHYAPAYYEDTDLAFKVRAAGLKVYVQPAVSVTHFEGVSSGTDLASGTKRYQLVNREKFIERWRGELALQPGPIKDPLDLAAVRQARDHRLRGRILIIDAYTPEPDQDSGSVRLVNLMRCLLEMGYGVTFFADNRAWDGNYTRSLQAMGVEACYDPWLGSAEAFIRERGRDFSQVIISRHYIAGQYVSLLRSHAPQAKFIFDTVDLHFLREERLAELENSTALRQVAKQTRRSEMGVIRAADATLVVSQVEQELLADSAPDADVFVLSNIHELGVDPPGFTQRKDVYFVGGYQHPPNIDAARWFVQEIWPLINKALPDVHFHLIGSKAPDAVRELGNVAGVTFHGFVERLEPFLDECRVSVAPLRYGAGVKGKVNQAMAHGQPVVATPAAVEGLHAVDGSDVLIAANPGDFAQAVIKLYQDQALWERLSVNGRRNVETHFSKDAAKRDISKLLSALED